MKVQSTTIPSISIESNSKTAIKDAENALTTIKRGTNGRALLDHLESFSQKGNRVKIFVAPRGGNMRNETRAVDDIDSPGSDNKNAIRNASKSILGFSGKGASAIVEWNPSKSLVLSPSGVPIGREDNIDKAYLSLGHELVHAYYIGNGKYKGGGGHEGFQPGTRSAEEELRAVGLGKWAGEPISENGIRADHKETMRTAYPLSQDENERLNDFDPTARYNG
ncbi:MULTISPECIES: XopG/HopH/AvrPtoH family type III secretion system effector [Burkholderiaceae]|uniref:XopG/HopH/AvrPtoH family type III secretion system effector n=1 Tax=Burkholderiaceae TaxID=119060 RepID=UPI001420F031|nr:MULTISPECIES: XopG/HopH/AvrPtoH family type III secretion system effector [Burkholderiaceae]MBN3849566.1 hypothetical protein [Paraburkholderia sp. Ac-20342]